MSYYEIKYETRLINYVKPDILSSKYLSKYIRALIV